MSSDFSVELRNENNVKVFYSLSDGSEIVCASKDYFIQLREISWPKMKVLLNEFADELDKEMIEFLLTPTGQILKGAGLLLTRDPIKTANLKSPEAFAIYSYYERLGNYHPYGYHTSLPALNDALKKHGLLSRYMKKRGGTTPEWNIVFEPFKTQQKVARSVVEPQIRTMDWALPKSYVRATASNQVLKVAEGCRSTGEFLERLCTRLKAWLNQPMRKGVTSGSTTGVDSPLSLGWFAVWLAERGYLLFPFSTSANRGAQLFPIRYRYMLNKWIRPKELRARSNALQADMQHFIGTGGEAAARCELKLLAINLSVPGLAYGRVSAESLSYLRESIVLNKTDISIIASVWRIEANRLKDQKYDPVKLQKLTDKVIQTKKGTAASEVLWHWIDSPVSIKMPQRAKYFRNNINAGPNLKNHAANLRLLFPSVAGKSAPSISQYGALWLLFLSTLDDDSVPKEIADASPALFSSIQADDVTTMRGFMAMENVPKGTQNAVYAALRAFWKAGSHIRGDELKLCPISVLTIFKLNRKLGTTSRRSIDMEILDLLIEENRADDFAFSKNRVGAGKCVDSRYVTDSVINKGVLEWWPGIAVLMDLLLQIPIRHSQGRYLDSGEGDEFELDLHSLRLVPNLSVIAEKGRDQAFLKLISLSPLNDEPGLGMYINTNKTGKDYTFPWLLPDIASNVKRVIDWQKRFNSIHLPVSSRGDSHAERNANVEPIWVFPIFRDPIKDDNQPVSRGIMLEYFRALLRRVESKYNLINNTSIRFFYPNGDPIFDIHSLRVTGVTRLLSMGVDPRVVQCLVGHASLAMTWYYDHVSNQRISSAMEKAIEARRLSKEELLKLSVDEREKYLSKLFNYSDKPTLSISLLRDQINDRSPLLDIRVDGMCPGMQCSEAGVWRNGACSLCKYFVTGPSFLAGLVLKLNNLMAELILAQQEVANLRDQLFDKRKRGISVKSLNVEIVRRDEVIDCLLTEWEAQFKYVKKCEFELEPFIAESAPLSELSKLDFNLSLVSQSPDKFRLSLHETHHLALYTRLIEGAKNIEGFAPTIGARDARDAMLLEIVRHEKKTDLFYQLSPKSRKVALDQFGLLLLDQELSSEDIESLIDGTSKLSAIDDATKWLDRLASADERLMLAISGDGNE